MKLSRGAGQVAIVTGASSGIGRAIALALAARGVHVVAAARRSGALSELAGEIARMGETCSPVPTDVTDRNAVHALVEKALRERGRIDVLVCSAGAYVRGRLQEVSLAELGRSMEVNFFGTILPVVEALPHMLARRTGHIVVVSSVDGKKGIRTDGPYVAAKSAVTGYMDVLRQDLRGTGVGVSTLLPGRVDTPMIRRLRVPGISAKISARRVARAALRAIEQNRAELLIPLTSSKAIILLSAISAPMGDFLIRLFRLEGKENSA